MGSGDTLLSDAPSTFQLALLFAPPSTGGAPEPYIEQLSEEQLDREVPEDHADGRLGRALERVLAHVEQGDATALEACKLVG